MKRANRKKTKGISKENLVVESENESDYAFDNEGGTTAEVEVYANKTDLSYEDKSYVMRKFLQNESSDNIAKPSNGNKLKKALTKNSKKHIDIDDNDVESNLSKISNETYNVAIPVPVTKPRKLSLKEIKQGKKNISSNDTQDKDSNSMYIHIENSQSIQYENETGKPKGKNKKKTKKGKETSDSISIKNRAKQREETINDDDEDEINEKIDDKKNSESDVDNNEKEVKGINNENSHNEILTVTISKTDRLLLNSYVFCATTIVYFIDSETGDFIKKSNPQRAVVIKNMENDSFVDYIGVVSTKNYNLINNRDLKPSWNETLLINENYSYLQNYNSLVIFFEIIESSNNANVGESERVIAWAFLKPKHNYNENLRLQLYYPQTTRNKHKCKAYSWWKKKKLLKYPSTLYVTLTNTQVPTKILKFWMSTGSSQKSAEESNQINENRTTLQAKHENNEISNREAINLKSLGNRSFKIPNEKLYEIKTNGNGCYVHKFSHNGDFLAVTNAEDDLFNIIIYETFTQNKICELRSHQNLIYDITWTPNNIQILSASADCTVILWDISLQKLEYTFAHPTFVYCCTASTENFFATGCYDKCIRIWSLTSYTLLNELKVHKGYVTTICFNKDNYFMYSGDSTGSIIMWQKEQEQWTTKKIINVLDLHNVVLNQIILHRRERRLIVNSRDGIIRLIDIKTGYVLQSYIRGSNELANIHCDTTPCDTYLISGSENGDIYIWSVDSGKTELIHSPYQVKVPIHCVQFHPYSNLFAISHFGSSLPIVIYGQQKNSRQAIELNAITHISKSMDLVPPDEFKLRKQGTNFRMILEKFDNIIK